MYRPAQGIKTAQLGIICSLTGQYMKPNWETIFSQLGRFLTKMLFEHFLRV